jgi:hypothetical protein
MATPLNLFACPQLNRNGKPVFVLKMFLPRKQTRKSKVVKLHLISREPVSNFPDQTFLINSSFVDKNGLSNRNTLKNLLTSIITLNCRAFQEECKVFHTGSEVVCSDHSSMAPLISFHHPMVLGA